MQTTVLLQVFANQLKKIVVDQTRVSIKLIVSRMVSSINICYYFKENLYKFFFLRFKLLPA